MNRDELLKHICSYVGGDAQTSAHRFAVVGPNGAGKSHLLKSLTNGLEGIPCCFIGTGDWYYSLDLGHLVLREAGQLPQTIEGLQALARKGFTNPMLRSSFPGYSIGNLVFALIETQRQSDEDAHPRYKNALVEWADRPEADMAERPSKPTPQVKRIFEIVGSVTGYDVSFAPPPVRGAPVSPMLRLLFRRGNEALAIEQLSDGDRRACLLAGLLALAGNERFVLLVDEPELHMNEARANEIWERLERAFPEAVFIYATHSLAFASRELVDRAFIMKMDHTLEDVDKTQPIPPNVIQEIVGARIQLLRTASPPLFCEDELQELVLTELLQGEDVKIVRLNGWQSVQAALRGDRAWASLRSRAKALGVVDRDTRSDTEVLALADDSIFCTPLYDAEVFLLVPELAVWMVPDSTLEDYVSMLRQAGERTMSATIKRIRSDLASRYRPEVRIDPTNETVAATIHVKDLEREARSKLMAFKRALQHGEPLEILRLFHGKTLYQNMREVIKRAWHFDLSAPEQQYLLLQRYSGFREKVASIETFCDFSQQLKRRLHAAE